MQIRDALAGPKPIAVEARLASGTRPKRFLWRRLVTGAATGCALFAGCDSSGPEPPPPPIEFEALSAGAVHTCALDTEGRAYCWGNGAQGQLGVGEVGSSPARFQPTPVASDLRFNQISAGSDRTCALEVTGMVYCWGTLSGYRGSPTVSLTPTTFPGTPLLVTVSVGDMHACGLTTDGIAYCWGDNDWGQLGTGTSTTSIEPVAVTGEGRFTAIAAGGNNTCALTAEGAAHCWGDNSRGQLGVPGTGPEDCVVALAQVHVDCSRAPVPVVGGLSFIALRTSCGLTADGTLYCWGSDLPMPRDPPTAASGPARVTDAPALDRFASGRGICGLTRAGEPVCFPAGAVSLDTPEPVVELSVGAIHICARTAARFAYCGGDNRDGQLGTGDSNSTTSLTPVAGPT